MILIAGCTNSSSTPFTTDITFTDELGVTVSGLPAAHWSSYYYAEITPLQGTAPYYCEMIQSSIPGQINFGGNDCALSGDVGAAPPGTTNAIYPFKFNIFDSTGRVAGPFDLSLTVTPEPPSFFAYLSTAYTGLPYETNLCSPTSNTPLNCGSEPKANWPNGGVPPYRFSASGLPLGLFIRSDGLISGTIPENALIGIYNPSICVTDSVGSETCITEELEVEKGCTSTKWTGTITAILDNKYLYCTGRVEYGCYNGYEYTFNADFTLDLKYDLADKYNNVDFFYKCEDKEYNHGPFSSTLTLTDSYINCRGEDSCECKAEGTNLEGELYLDMSYLISYSGFYDDYTPETVPFLVQVTCYDELGSYREGTWAVHLENCVVSNNNNTVTCDCPLSIILEGTKGICTFNRV